jgi:hypothetical protein
MLLARVAVALMLLAAPAVAVPGGAAAGAPGTATTASDGSVSRSPRPPRPVRAGKQVRPAPLATPKLAKAKALLYGAKPVPLTTARPQLLAATTDQVGLRALVIAVDADDFGVPTWKSTLDRVGAAYDVLYSRTTALTTDTLVGPDGTGKYNAILLTNNGLYYIENGLFLSGLDATEWNLLWGYERDYGVRQASLYTSYGTAPEDYCLRAVSEGGVGDTPLNATLTSTGASVFDYLKSTAQVPVTQSYVYRTSIAAGCAADPILTAGSDVLGVRSTSTDGRERIALTFTSNQYLLQADLLVYGLFRWASRGLYLGERRHYLSVDVDDWFNSSDHLFPDGHLETDPGFTLTAHDAYNLNLRQNAARAAFPLASTFRLNLAYNGGDANLSAGTTCSPFGGVSQFTATTRCLANRFRWLNHTLTHPKLNFTDYATSLTEIQQNFAVGQTLGLPTPTDVLKTGEYSGLGVYNPDPNAPDADPPTDFGLNASNPNLLAAAKDLGVKYLHGNMSFPSHVPSCFNCAIVHPMEPAITVVPDWPTNIAYHTTTPAEETYFYNSFYGPNGRFPFWPQDLTYQQIIDYEAGVALQHMTSGSIYTHTMHISNVRDYGSGRTLLTDWLTAVLTKYSAYFSVPVLNPAWPALAQYAGDRTGHFAELAAGASAVYDRVAGTVTVTSPSAGKVTVSGAQGTGSSTYGTDVATPVTLTAGASVTVAATPRP